MRVKKWKKVAMSVVLSVSLLAYGPAFQGLCVRAASSGGGEIAGATSSGETGGVADAGGTETTGVTGTDGTSTGTTEMMGADGTSTGTTEGTSGGMTETGTGETTGTSTGTGSTEAGDGTGGSSAETGSTGNDSSSTLGVGMLQFTNLEGGAAIEIKGASSAIEGVSFDAESNTLTLTDFKQSKYNLLAWNPKGMLTIRLAGENVLAGIEIMNVQNDYTLAITGEGSLVVNEEKHNTFGIVLGGTDSETNATDCRLHVHSLVNLTVYGNDYVIRVNRTSASETNALQFDDQTGELSIEPAAYSASVDEREIYKEKNVGIYMVIEERIPENIYDEDGNVIDYRFAYLLSELVKNESGDYEIGEIIGRAYSDTISEGYTELTSIPEELSDASNISLRYDGKVVITMTPVTVPGYGYSVRGERLTATAKEETIPDEEATIDPAGTEPPSAGEETEAPTGGNGTEASLAGEGTEPPTGGNGTEASPAGEGTEPPTGGNGTEASPAGEVTETPTDEGGTEPPSVGEKTEAPAGEGGTEVPPAGEETKAPTGEDGTKIPPAREETEAPTGEDGTKTPPAGEIVSTSESPSGDEESFGTPEAAETGSVEIEQPARTDVPTETTLPSGPDRPVPPQTTDGMLPTQAPSTDVSEVPVSVATEIPSVTSQVTEDVSDVPVQAATEIPSATAQASADVTIVPVQVPTEVPTTPAPVATEAAEEEETLEIGALEILSSGTYTVTKSEDGTTEVEYTSAAKNAKKVTIPSTITVDGVECAVTSIAAKAFSGNTNLTSVTIPSTVETIGANAFKNCKKLTKLTLPKSVRSLGRNAFSGCKRLNTLMVKSKNIKSVGSNAFKGVPKTATIKVPAGKKAAYAKLFKKAGFKGKVK